MKISEHMENMRNSLPPELAEILLSQGSIWTNEACYGYCIAAMKEVGLKRTTIDKVIHGLRIAFDTIGVEEAEDLWRKF